MPHVLKLASITFAAGALASACGASVPEARTPLAPTVELTVHAPDRMLSGARVPVVLELTNRGERSVPIEDARARVEVRWRGEPVCGAGPDWVDIEMDAASLAPAESVRFATESPCVVRAPGEYELWVDLVVGPAREDEERAPRPTDDLLAASSTITVEERFG